jgi:proteasome lid subunit RPN8/RPN11
MRRVRFLRSQLENLRKEAKRIADTNGGEICGLILDNGSFFELLQVRNKRKSAGGFSFYFNEVRSIQKRAEACKREIVGTFHSHPVGLAEPGPSDLSNARDDSVMLIFDVKGRIARLWHIENLEGKQVRFSVI